MTMLVSKYKIEVEEEPEFAGETFVERHARVTAFKRGLTIIVSDTHIPMAILRIALQACARALSI